MKVPVSRTSIVVRTRFEAVHFWQDAPDEVEFLRHPHRHEFHVELKLEVYHHDRELEFIMVKRALDAFIAEKTPKHPVKMSCEHMATEILKWARQGYGMRRASCQVSEDGENGALVEITLEWPDEDPSRRERSCVACDSREEN